MKLSRFEKAQKVYEQVKQLDKEIIEIEKIAGMVANGRNEIKLSIKLNDLEKQKDSDKVKFDDDGSLVMPGQNNNNSFSFLVFSSPPRKEEERKYTTRLDDQLTDEATLQVLGVLIMNKNEKRQALIIALQKIGLEI
jgi:hypothetical protein